MRSSFFILVISLLVLSCTRKDRCGCFDSNGSTITESRNLTSFNQLEIDDVFDITLHLNNNPRIDIETGKHLLKGIETQIENNRLIIKNKNICNWVRNYRGKIKLNIYCDSLSYIKLWESCDIRCTDTVKVNQFVFDNFADISTVDMNFNCFDFMFAVHAGTGQMNLKGKADICYLWTLGYCHLDCSNLETDYCFITNNSTGNSYIKVNKELEATIENSGNIYYSGNPYKVSPTEKGKGRLIRY